MYYNEGHCKVSIKKEKNEILSNHINNMCGDFSSREQTDNNIQLSYCHLMLIDEDQLNLSQFWVGYPINNISEQRLPDLKQIST